MPSHALEKHHQAHVGTYIFRNSFFRHNIQITSIPNVIGRLRIFLLKSERAQKFVIASRVEDMTNKK
jgi:hypothetical protein